MVNPLRYGKSLTMPLRYEKRPAKKRDTARMRYALPAFLGVRSECTSTTSKYKYCTVRLTVRVRYTWANSCFHSFDLHLWLNFVLVCFDPTYKGVSKVINGSDVANSWSQTFSSACRRPFWKPMQCIASSNASRAGIALAPALPPTSWEGMRQYIQPLRKMSTLSSDNNAHRCVP